MHGNSTEFYNSNYSSWNYQIKKVHTFKILYIFWIQDEQECHTCMKGRINVGCNNYDSGLVAFAKTIPLQKFTGKKLDTIFDWIRFSFFLIGMLFEKRKYAHYAENHSGWKQFSFNINFIWVYLYCNLWKTEWINESVRYLKATLSYL